MKISNKIRLLALILPIVVIMVSVSAGILAEQAPVNLGTTASFAVMAGTTITNTGTTVINGDAGGDVGLYPGSDFTGQSTVSMTGALHISDAVATQAQTDLTAAYDDAAGRTPATLIAAELGGTTLKPGVYYSTEGTFLITGTLTLDAENDPDGVFIFLTTATLITADNSSIDLVNAARYCRIFWKVGSSATLGVNSHFVGHLFALTSITANTGASIQGQLLARNGAVTLHANTIMNGLCAEEANSQTSDTSSEDTNPQTSDSASVIFLVISIMTCIVASAVFVFRKSKEY
ncbi:MAG: ice-binding family protein [Saccharofermentanales bacterium]